MKYSKQRNKFIEKVIVFLWNVQNVNPNTSAKTVKINNYRKTLCYSKSVEMLKHSIRLLIHYLKFKDIPIPYRFIS